MKGDDVNGFLRHASDESILDLLHVTRCHGLLDDVIDPTQRAVSERDSDPTWRALSGAVRPDDRRDPRREFEMCAMYEGLESGHRERLQHGAGHAPVDHAHVFASVVADLVGHFVTSASRRAAALSCASRFDAPVPFATWPATSTSTTKSRRCSGPVASRTRYIGSESFEDCAHSCSSVFADFALPETTASSSALMLPSTSARAAANPPST